MQRRRGLARRLQRLIRQRGRAAELPGRFSAFSLPFLGFVGGVHAAWPPRLSGSLVEREDDEARLVEGTAHFVDQ